MTTPLGADALLPTALNGREGLSELFRFRVDALADNRRRIPFEALLGQPVSVTLEPPAGLPPRHFSGICSRLSQGDRDARFTRYELEIVPALWLLTRAVRSRAFQSLSVPQVLERVLPGSFFFEVTGELHPHEYIGQYRETDFDFVSRLMAEEGIFYFFRHSAEGHTLVLADSPESHPELPAVQYDARAAPGTVFAWEKSQELRSGKVALRDHDFQLPGSSLEAVTTIQPTVQAGTVEHTLALPAVQQLELYDFPGEYAARFDGIDADGGEQPDELEKIVEDGQRLAGFRMQAEAATALTIRGASTAASLTAGHAFSLARHFDADGKYVLTGVEHAAEGPSPDGGRTTYSNSFTCIPAGLPFRPQQEPRPSVPPQSALVVGPRGGEIFTDKYGRVKVQFHWDREGKSSVWVRVAHPATGAGFLPAVGDEVLVAFEHGDVRRPYVVGSLYNTSDTPPEDDDR